PRGCARRGRRPFADGGTRAGGPPVSPRRREPRPSGSLRIAGASGARSTALVAATFLSNAAPDGGRGRCAGALDGARTRVVHGAKGFASTLLVLPVRSGARRARI